MENIFGRSLVCSWLRAAKKVDRLISKFSNAEGKLTSGQNDGPLKTGVINMSTALNECYISVISYISNISYTSSFVPKNYACIVSEIIAVVHRVWHL